MYSALLITIVSILDNYYFRQREEKHKLIESFNLVENDLLRLLNAHNSFFRNEISNAGFFETGKSKYLEQSQSFTTVLLRNLDNINTDELSENSNIKSDIDTIKNQLIEFNSIFKQMVSLIKERGYKDYGLVGNMRHEIHILQETERINQSDILMLRRHEKDYIIRNEQRYIDKLNSLAEKVRVEWGMQYFQQELYDSFSCILGRYQNYFNQIVLLDKQIGIKDNQGLKQKLDGMSTGLSLKISKLTSNVAQEQAAMLSQSRINYIIQFIVSILLSFLISFAITKRLSHSIINLTRYIAELTKNGLSSKKMTISKKTDKEIALIYNEFNKMIAHLEKRQKQRDKALLDLEKQETRYRQMANLLPVCLFETNDEGYLSYINNQFKKTFCFEGNDWQKVKLDEILESDRKPYNGKLSNEEDLVTFEAKAVTSNNSTFPVHIISNRVKGPTRTGSRGVIMDMTDRMKFIEDLRKSKKQAEESDRLKSAFIANMSHEIRTPMNAIIGFSDLLTFETDPTLKEEFLNTIQNSGRMLLKLIDDILDISKIEAGQITIIKERFNLDNLILEIHKHFKNEIEKRNVNVDLILDTDTGKQLFPYSDPYRIKQVITNLVSNAVKFTSEGFISIGYRLEENFIRIFVQDTGIGIPSEKVQVIFERFRQVDEGLNREHGGTGLGLTISKNLVDLLGGEISATSEVGKGTRFEFTIPTEKMEMQTIESLPQTKLPTQRQHDWSHFSVLIAEDDKYSQKFLESLLLKTGINIRIVSNGQEALEAFFEQDNFDIILMDINMPVMNGLEATEKIKSFSPRTPIIAQTAYALSDEKEKCYQAGCDDYIPKPIKRRDLIDKMARFLTREHAPFANI